MRAEYTYEEERQLRMTEIEAILDNGLCTDHREQRELEDELKNLMAEEQEEADRISHSLDDYQR